MAAYTNDLCYKSLFHIFLRNLGTTQEVIIHKQHSFVVNSLCLTLQLCV